ncbi:MAG TPA: type II CAAX endopeptidase family protein [Vineibacter sp.]|nr:type II CAAX endopeptidase family protein [Vineibacter sp.]
MSAPSPTGLFMTPTERDPGPSTSASPSDAVSPADPPHLIDEAASLGATPNWAKPAAPPPRLGFLDLVLALVAGGVCMAAGLVGVRFALGAERVASLAQGADPSGLLLVFTVFFAAMVVAVWVGVLRHGKAGSALLGLRPCAARWWWLAPLCVVALSVAMDELLLRLMRSLFDLDLTPQTSHVIAALAKTVQLSLVATIAIGLLGPFAEELLFRGLIYGYVDGRFGARAAWIASSILFALAHAEPAHVALVVPLGLVLGWIRWQSASLWPCIAAHIANNTLVVWWAFLDS